jgi:ferritin-like metal-binding protein YciE
MNITSLRDLYIAELQEIRGVEEQLIGALLAILEEEKRTDERLSRLAKRVVNPDAAAT